MGKYTRYTCKYCAAKTSLPASVCTNCKEKLTVLGRIKAFLASCEKE